LLVALLEKLCTLKIDEHGAKPFNIHKNTCIKSTVHASHNILQALK